MRVWTNGVIHLVADRWGLHSYERLEAGGGTRRATSAPNVVLRTSAPAAPADWTPKSLLAAPSSARVAWTGTPRSRPWAVPLPKGEPSAVAQEVLDLVALDDERVLAAIIGGTAKKPSGKLVVGRLQGGEAAWEHDLPLPRQARVEWPEPLVWARSPWGKRATMGLSITLSRGPHGTVLLERETGIVAVIRPGTDTIAFALRIPTQEEATSYAAATREGVVVVVCVEGRESGICHFDAEGRCLASLRRLGDEVGWSMGPPVLVRDDRVLVTSAFTSPRLFVLAMPELAELGAVDLSCDIRGEQTAHVAPSGDAALFGFGEEAWLATRFEQDAWHAERLHQPQAARDAASRAPSATAPPSSDGPRTSRPPPSLERVKGPPNVTLVPQRAPTWSARVGERLELEMAVASNGGPGMGLYFELSGPWIASGHLRPRRVAVGPLEATFVIREGGTARAELPTVELPPGLVAPPEAHRKGSPPITATAIYATLTLDVTGPGHDLLSMRVGPLGAKTPGSGSFAHSKRLEVVPG